MLLSLAPNVTPKPGIAGSRGGAGDKRFNWETFVSRALHPIQLAMVEALIFIGLPISPGDLSQMYGEDECTPSHTGYHIKFLVDHDIIELFDTEQVRGTTRHLYVLVPTLTWG
jgi:hypothetical protein